MPVILVPEDYEKWLSEDARADELREILAPFPADQMNSFPVSPEVNHARAEGPQLVEAVAVEADAQGVLFE
jgi:putative SOS response-associated peptidase YedK